MVGKSLAMKGPATIASTLLLPATRTRARLTRSSGADAGTRAGVDRRRVRDACSCAGNQGCLRPRAETAASAVCNHVCRDELAKSDAGVKSFCRDINQVLVRGDLHLDLGIRLAEGCNQRLQQDRHHRGRHCETQQSGRPLSEVTRNRASRNKLLEGGLCPRQKAFAGFSQTDAARRADEQRRADARLERADRGDTSRA